MNTTPLGQSDTPRTDAGRDEYGASVDISEALERELTAARERTGPVALRGNLERLAAWWGNSVNGCGDWPHPEDELRRVLAGEIPPEPGQEWPAVPAMGPADNPDRSYTQGIARCREIEMPDQEDAAEIDPADNPAISVKIDRVLGLHDDPAALDVHAGGPAVAERVLYGFTYAEGEKWVHVDFDTAAERDAARHLIREAGGKIITEATRTMLPRPTTPGEFDALATRK